MDSRLLVVLSGPIASGKSSAAEALAVGFRATGRSAAAVDLDLLYKMIDAGQPMDNPSSWRQARRAAASLADEFVLAGVDMVIVEGTFWTKAERDEFVNHLATDIRPHFVTLRVSLPEAQRRVEVDITRRSSRVPAVLTSCHVAFAATVGALDSAELVVDTTTVTADQVAAMIIASLEDASSSSDRRALFRKVDCLQIPVPNVEAGLAFYRDALGHALIWRTDTAAGLRMAESSSEIVIQTERPQLEANLTVRSADEAADAMVRAGGNVVVSPFDIAIGRCAVMADPWGNRLVILDTSKGLLMVDSSGRVGVDAEGKPRVQSDFRSL
jgi:lactoylglutathione lyase